MTIALLSTAKLPKFLGDDHPDEAALFAEDDVLAQALAARGAEARRVAWRRPGAPWGRYDLVLLRSTWDYIDDVPGFLRVLGEIEGAGCRLVNPRATVEWNLDKRYLTVLGRQGVPVVPTALFEAGQEPRAVVGDLGPCETGFVVKPLVGVGAYGAKRLADAPSTVDELARDPGAPRLVQPFLASVATEGEWSFVFGGGRFLYAALKTPRAGDFRVQVMYGARTVARTPAAADLARAKACHDALPVPAHFARIDMARLPSGRLALMEAELIEPQLFFHEVPRAADLVAEVAVGLLAAPPRSR